MSQRPRLCRCIILPVTEEVNSPFPDHAADSDTVIIDEAAIDRANRVFNKDRGLVGKLNDKLIDYLRNRCL